MVNIVVAGLPKAVKLPKFLNFLMKVVFKAHKEFLINYTKPMVNDHRLKQISFNMKSNDARKALRFLCDYQYVHANISYTLQCWMEEGREQNEDMFSDDVHEPMRRDHVRGFDNYEPPRKNRRFSKSPMRSRSRSPYHSSELREIELKIDLIRKQRILMEEETKLLLEKRKLEYLQNIGTNDYAKLAMFEEICNRNEPNEISDFVETLQPKMIKKRPMLGGKLPNFLGPCKEITSQMHAMIRSHPDIDDEYRTFFWKLLRSTLKKRLAVVLEGKGFLSTTQIVALYRTKHPETTDKALVDELINTISSSCWPKKNKGKKVETAKAIDEGQKNENENPGTGKSNECLRTRDTNAQPKVSDAKELIEGDDATKNVDPDEFVDLNDVENWEDEVQESEQVDNAAEPSKDEAEVYPPKIGSNDDLEAEEENVPVEEKDIDEADVIEIENVIVDRVGETKQAVDNEAVKDTEKVKKQ